MRQMLLTVSVVLSAAGAASAQAVPVPAVPAAPAAPRAAVAPLPPAPAPLPPPAPAPFVISTPGLHAVTVDLDHQLASLREHASWSAEAEKWAAESARWAEEGAKWAEQAVQFNFAQPQPFGQSHSQVEGLYSQARGFIDRNQYDRALSPLDRVISAKAERADAAMYWKAYTLYKLARRDEALLTVGQMQKDFPQSAWLRDARALEVEIKQSAGQPVGTDTADDDIKLLALQGIMRSNPDTALPVIDKMLSGPGNVRLKERALFVISQNRSDRAREIIANVARSNANPDLQQTAIRLLGQSNTPESIAALSSLYRADQSIETRRAIIQALSNNRSNTAATSALIAIGRTERNPDLRKQIVTQLSNSRTQTPEVQQFLMEIISGGAK